jgi:hypothetical protein
MRPYLVLLNIILALALALVGCGSDYEDDDSSGDDDVSDDDDLGDDDVADDDSAGDDDDFMGNHPPTEPLVQIEPETPAVGEALTCAVLIESEDEDNDPIAYAFDWDRDGVNTGISGDSVPASATLDMGEWTCRARAFDGEDFSGEVTDSAFVGPGGLYFEISMVAQGGVGPGTATAIIDWIMVDDPSAKKRIDLCSYTYNLSGTFEEVGAGQGDDFFEGIDEVVWFDLVQSVYSTCPTSLDDVFAPVTDPLDDPNISLAWWLNPFAIISCDVINARPDLAETSFLDDAWALGLSDDTLGAWCNEYGPMVAYSSGEMEGLWVRPSDSSTGAQGLGVEHLPALNGDVGGLGLYDSWSVLGFFHAATNNPSEPTPGLEGTYSPFPLWIWSY